MSRTHHQIVATDGQSARSSRLAWIIVLGAFAGGLDASVVNVGLHTLTRELATDLTVAQWVATAYVLALALALPLTGWACRRVGAGRLWLGSLACFTLASALCAAAASVEWLIAFRVLQGIAGGLLIPAGQALLGEMVGPDRLGRVMASLGVAVTAAPALGPVVAGLVLEAANWRWLFLLNLPLGAIGLVLGHRYLPPGRRDPAAPRPNLASMACIGLGLPSLMYALHAALDAPMDPSVVIASVAGVAALAGFLHLNRRARHPLLDLTLFRLPGFGAAAIATATTGALLFGTGLLFPLYFQLVQHDSVIGVGVHLVGLAGPTALTLPIAGRMVDRHGPGRVATAGSAIILAAAVGFLALSLPAPPLMFHVLLALLGTGIALAAVPPGVAAYKLAAAAQLADATAIVNIVQRVAGAFGGVIFAVTLAVRSDPVAGFTTSFGVMAALAGAALGASVKMWRAHAPGTVTRASRDG